MNGGVAAVVGRFGLLRLGLDVDFHDATRSHLVKSRSQFIVRGEGDAIVVFIDVLKSELPLLVIAVQLGNRCFQCSVDIGVG